MIVTGVDGSMAARAAVQWAAGDAMRMHVPLLIVHVTGTVPYQAGRSGAAFPRRTRSRDGRRALREAEALVRERQPTIEVTTKEVTGEPATALLEQADDGVELVLGSYACHASFGAVPSPVNMHVAELVRCPIVLVRAEHRTVYGEVVVGVDGSPACGPALTYAFLQAELREATLRVVHAWQTPAHAVTAGNTRGMSEVTAERLLARDLVKAVGHDHPRVPVVEDLLRADPVTALTAAAGQADLLVVGWDRATAPEPLGQVSRGVLRRARCPVAVVHSWAMPEERGDRRRR
ncbi:universal stress protein [Nonomuraea sp. NPDC048826]|uniref:universal stress protein n=1 Tax=Nonomuraea sp. NPDC048826 TaxID=3364347 RepID=UPI00371A92CD